MLRRILTTLVFAFALAAGVASACSPKDALENGPLAAAIRHEQSKGWIWAETSWEPCPYLVPPKPPYLDGMVTVTLYAPAPEESHMASPRLVLAADVWATNDKGTCVVRDVRVVCDDEK